MAEIEKMWRTKISALDPDKVLVRGYNLVDMAGRYLFGDVVFLLFTGELPKGNEGRMLEAILVSTAEMSILAPSTRVARTVASCGVPLQAAVAAGVSALGEYHGGAIEQCARVLQEGAKGREGDWETVAAAIVEESRRAGQRVLGFGHPRFKVDPRTERLFSVAEQLGVAGKHIALARAMQQALSRSLRRDMPLNVDGAIAAILSDLGIPWQLGKGIFLIARTAGLSAHVFEELSREKPFKKLSAELVEWDGVPERPLPPSPPGRIDSPSPSGRGSG